MPRLLLIGAGPGIGQSVACRFASEGFDVSLVARRQSTLDGVGAAVASYGGAVSTHPADAGDPTGLRRVIDDTLAALGTPDVVVYNAGLIQADSLGQLTPDEHLRAWSVNVLGALVTADATLPAMVDEGAGTWLATGGMPVPSAQYVSLSLGKSGVRAMTTMLAEFYGPLGIHAATVTVAGAVRAGTAYAPDAIAQHYWRLHSQAREDWETDYLFQA